MSELELEPEETLPPQMASEDEDDALDVEAAWLELLQNNLPDFPFFSPTVAQAENFFKARCTLEAALKTVDASDMMIGSMRSTFISEMEFYETESVRAPAGVVYSAFEWLGAQTLRLKSALRSNDQENTLYALQEIRSTLDSLLTPFRQINDVADLEPHHSDSNDIQEVCRVGYAFIAERLPSSAFLGRLLPYWDKFQNFRKQLADYNPPQPKVAAWNLLYQDFLPTLERIEELLADLERVAKEEKREELRDGLENLIAAGDEIANIEMELSKIA